MQAPYRPRGLMELTIKIRSRDRPWSQAHLKESMFFPAQGVAREVNFKADLCEYTWKYLISLRDIIVIPPWRYIAQGPAHGSLLKTTGNKALLGRKVIISHLYIYTHTDLHKHTHIFNWAFGVMWEEKWKKVSVMSWTVSRKIYTLKS